MAEALVKHGAAAGIALDEMPIALLADETGHVLDGDQILACLAVAMKADGTLAGDGVVGTVMSNRAFKPSRGHGQTLPRASAIVIFSI